MEQAISKEETKAYDRGIYATFLGAFLVLFQIGIYFVYIPWNAERLQITEAEIGLGLITKSGKHGVLLPMTHTSRCRAG